MLNVTYEETSYLGSETRSCYENIFNTGRMIVFRTDRTGILTGERMLRFHRGVCASSDPRFGSLFMLCRFSSLITLGGDFDGISALQTLQSSFLVHLIQLCFAQVIDYPGSVTVSQNVDRSSDSIS